MRIGGRYENGWGGMGSRVREGRLGGEKTFVIKVRKLRFRLFVATNA